MTKTVLQIENIEATDLLDRLNRMESAIASLSTNIPTSTAQQILSGYVTRREVAKLFKISLVTLNDWTNKGILQAYKIGNRVYYKQYEIETAVTKKGGMYVCN